jgi:hypothetical protein
MPREKVWNIEPTPAEAAAARERRERRGQMVKRVSSHGPLLIAVLLVSSAVAAVSMELRMRSPEDDAVGVFKFRHVRRYLNHFGASAGDPSKAAQPGGGSGGGGRLNGGTG